MAMQRWLVLARSSGRRLAAVVLLFSLLASLAPVSPVLGDEYFPYANFWSRMTPSVFWANDPTQTAKIEVHVVGRTDVAMIEVNLGSGLFMLYDDGTHGDTVAGDRVFTRTGVSVQCRAWTYDESISTIFGDLFFTLSDQTRQRGYYNLQYGCVDQRYKGVFGVHSFGGGLSATNYAFFIVDSAHEVFDGYPLASLRCGTTSFEAYHKLYSVLPDVFDIVVVTPGLPLFHASGFGEQVPYQVQVKNQVQHIGLPLINDTARFGSAGRLMSTVYHSFGSIQIFDHEVAHTWGAGIGSSLGLIEEGSPGRYHWEAMSDIGGQLGYYYFGGGLVGHFAYNGDGTWRLIANTTNERYAPLELYVMGLIPPEQVPPIHILTSPNLSDPNRITAASVATRTIQQIMAAEGGARSPTAAQSSRSFNVAYVVVQDIPYNDAAYAYFSILSRQLTTRQPPEGYNMYAPFYWATGGRATLNTLLPFLDHRIYLPTIIR